MAIASNFPAIRPSLNLDFANARALDPRITFSRASAAAYYDGKTVAKAEENLLLNSAILATQSVTTRAEPYTLSFIGTGTVTLSGTSIAGPLVGTGAANRVSLTFTPTAGTLTLTVTGSVEQAQLEARSVATAYTPTTTQPITNYIPVLQTAPAGVPRFDHNPVTGESLGLLVEEQRTNLLVNSTTLSSANYVGGIRNANQLVAPDGTQTASVISGNGAASSTWAQFATAAATTMTFSCYVKAVPLSTKSNFLFLLRNNTTSTNFVIGTFSTITGTMVGEGWTVTSLANGWFRLSYTNTSSQVINIGDSVTCYLGAIGSTIYQVTDAICVWGAQLEAGAFPTSYIKTEASQVTRAADLASMTGTNFSSWYRPDEGTFVYKNRPTGLSSTDRYHFIVSETQIVIPNSISSRTYNAGLIAAVYIDSSAQSSFSYGGMVVGKENSIALAYKTNDFAFSIGGSAAATDTSGLVPRTLSRFDILSNSCQHMARITYYPKRLTDAQLQALTA